MNFSYAGSCAPPTTSALQAHLPPSGAQHGIDGDLPSKPFTGINGSGMHTNFSLGKGGKNIFHDPKGSRWPLEIAWDFILRLLNHAPEICLILNSSVNSYQRQSTRTSKPPIR